MKIINQLEAVRKLDKGCPLIFQTDTLPAIGCKPEFYELIYKIKKRNKNKALILMGSNIQQVLDYVHDSAKDDFLRLAGKFWPGSLTLIIPVSNKKNLDLITKANTLGIRIPNCSTAQSLISKTGPLATSSANISGLKTYLTAEAVSNALPDLEILGPVPWEECSGLGSTIISWTNGGKWKLIREGEIPFSRIS